jgi:hypothetical protein
MTATPRPSRMARMLLRSGLLGLVSIMSACVLPIAPEFQDPPSSANIAPAILDATPALGSIVTATNPSSVPSFTVFASDMNVGDTLRVRWIADFPPFTANTRVLAERTFTQPDDSVTPDCVVNNLAKIPQHQIMVVVADGDFASALDLTKLKDMTRKEVIGSWILNLDCP